MIEYSVIIIIIIILLFYYFMNVKTAHGRDVSINESLHHCINKET